MALSALLMVIGAWLIGYSVIDKFTGREYGDVTADGSVSRLPAYDIWAKRNDRRTAWGLAIVTLGGLLQIVALYIPEPTKENKMTSERKWPDAIPGNAFPMPGTKTQEERAKEAMPASLPPPDPKRK